MITFPAAARTAAASTAVASAVALVLAASPVSAAVASPHTAAAAGQAAPGGLAPAIALRAGVPLVGARTGTSSSFNSAGYAASRRGVRFRLVKATFFVPYLACRLSKGASSADWVGLDGFVGSPDSVEQDGVEADCSTAGRPSYHAWYAMYPRQRVNSRIKVSAGDSVTASVYFDSVHRRFQLDLTDNSTGAHFSARAACPAHVTCPRNSAEMISSATDTEKKGKLVIRPLADYGAVSFGSIALTDDTGHHGGLRSSHWSANRIIDTERKAPFSLIARPTQTQGTTFDNYWSKVS